MKIEWNHCFRLGVSVFLLYLCILYWNDAVGFVITLLGAAAPLWIGCVIAYLLNILMSFYERHYFVKSNHSAAIKSRRPVCMAAAFLTLIAVIALILRLVVPQLSSCIQLIFATLPDTLAALTSGLESLNILPETVAHTLSAVDWQSKTVQFLQVLTSGFGNVMDVVIRTISTVFSGFVTALLSTIFAIYLLIGKETLRRQCNRLMKRYLKPRWYDKTIDLLSVLNDCFHRYIVGQCTEAVILGLLCIAGMLLLRLPYAAMIGALVGFTALIPVAGAYLGAGVGAFMILTVSPVKAVIFLIFIVVLQQLEGNLIYPRVVGSSLGLPAIWVLAAVTVGGGMMGVFGMLLSVPLAAAAYRLLREDIHKPSGAA
ncbi:MAG: AI-2E family transporter [Eubacteriales bacterium]|nr:AI-2E family transporter [Eubacteriales bacterium]